MARLTESLVESAVLAWLEEMGYGDARGPAIAADAPPVDVGAHGRAPPPPPLRSPRSFAASRAPLRPPLRSPRSLAAGRAPLRPPLRSPRSFAAGRAPRPPLRSPRSLAPGRAPPPPPLRSPRSLAAGRAPRPPLRSPRSLAAGRAPGNGFRRLPLRSGDPPGRVPSSPRSRLRVCQPGRPRRRLMPARTALTPRRMFHAPAVPSSHATVPNTIRKRPRTTSQIQTRPISPHTFLAVARLAFTSRAYATRER